MVDSTDEPPLRGLHSWAKNLNPWRDRENKDPTGATSNKTEKTSNILPQHAGDTESVGQQATSSVPSNTNIQDIQRQDAHAVDKKRAGTQPAPMNPGEEDDRPVKAPIHQRFMRDTKRVIRASWINWLLIFVPAGIIIGAMEEWGGMHSISPTVVFAINAIAIIPLASLLAYATESVAIRMGDTWGALLNVTFGNAVEIIVFVIGLIANEIRVVQAAAIGSILSNLLLILGMAFVLGGLRFREQVYNTSVSQMSACLLCVSVVSLLLPTVFHSAFANDADADRLVIKVSRGTSVILLLVYILYLLFQLKSHAYMYESTPQHIVDEESHPGILAQMLDSSSSSSSESSSSDSDSTAGSIKTTKRIKRALRRRRRKSSSSTRDSGPGAISRSGTNTETLVNTPIPVDEAIASGDEADGEVNRHARGTSEAVQTRDFETESSLKRDKRRWKRSKEEKREKKEAMAAATISQKEKISEKDIPAINVKLPEPVEEIADDPSPRTHHHHARNLASAIKPVLNSANFPHHEALTRSLAPPVFRTQSRNVVPSGEMRRTISMPDIHRQTSPIGRQNIIHPPIQQANSDPEAQIIETVEAVPHLSTTSAVVMLLISTGLVALCAEFLVGSIDYLISTSGVSQAFVGLIILPIVGNAAEHITAVTVAYKNKMDLSINIALGSSIQIALFVTPLMVMLGWAMDRDMSLYFSLFEVVSLFASVLVAGFMMIDGRSNWLEGALLIAAYSIIAISAFFIPTCGLSDTNGLVDTPRLC